MQRYVITANFHVFLPGAGTVNGRPAPEVRKSFTRGQVLTESDIPEGFSIEDWIAKGLAMAATPPSVA